MRKFKLFSFTLLSAVALPLAAQQALPKLQLAEQITLSGLSSGAYMAGQYHLAFAEQVSGVAMLAGGPVYCAQNSLGLALEHCFNKASSSPDMSAINQYLTAQRTAGKLAPVTALKDDKVWIFHGSKDTTVYPGLAGVLNQQYQQWVDAGNIALITDKAFGHTFPTDNTALGSCDVSEAPFLASCNYDAAGELLKHLLGSVKAKAATSSGRLITINQHQLAAAAKDTLAETGYLYVPQSCASGESCRLHVSFHGCKQNAASGNNNSNKALKAPSSPNSAGTRHPSWPTCPCGGSSLHGLLPVFCGLFLCWITSSIRVTSAKVLTRGP